MEDKKKILDVIIAMDSTQTAVQYTCGFQISQDRGDQEKKKSKKTEQW